LHSGCLSSNSLILVSGLRVGWHCAEQYQKGDDQVLHDIHLQFFVIASGKPTALCLLAIGIRAANSNITSTIPSVISGGGMRVMFGSKNTCDYCLHGV